MKKSLTDFDTLISDRNLSDEDVFYGTFTKEQLLDSNEQVFAGKAGEVVGPVKTDLGPVIYRIKEIKPAETTSFEEAKPDLEIEYKLHEITLELINQKLLNSAHDISEGGLFASLIESMIPGKFGCEIYTDPNFRQDAYLFGESQSRILVSLEKKKEKQFINLLRKNKFPYYKLGQVSLDKILIDDVDFGNIQKLESIYSSSLEKHLA